MSTVAEAEDVARLRAAASDYPEHSLALDDEDGWRLAYARLSAHRAAEAMFEMRRRALSLVQVLSYDRRFVQWNKSTQARHLSDRQRAYFERLFWRYRRSLPRHLRPTVNPDDPIVRERRAKEMANA
jgi:hypothetical protein